MRSESSALQLEVVAGQRPREKERGAPPRTERRADAKRRVCVSVYQPDREGGVGGHGPPSRAKEPVLARRSPVEQPKPLGRKEAATVVLSLYNQTLAAAGRPPDNGLRGGTEGAVGPWRFSG